jgi:outer membrane protein
LEAEDYPLPQANVGEIFAVAVENMPQVRAAELSVTSAEYGIKIAKGGFFPTLRLGGNLFSNFVDQSAFGSAEDFNTQINNNLSQALGLNLSIPVFSNFRNKVNLQRARVQRNLNEVQELEVKNLLRQDIETSYTNAFASRQSYRSSRSQVASLEEAFRMAQQRFEVGAINSVDFQVAQNNLFNAQADLLNAKYEYIFRVKVLDFYLGNPITL